MILQCIRNTGTALGPFQTGLFYTEDTVFDLSVGREYVAAALGVFQSGLIVLVRDEYDQPGWYPLALFSATTSELPPTWSFRFFGESDRVGALSGWEALWGYHEIVHSPGHLEEVTEGGLEALRIFNARLAELTEWAKGLSR